MNDPQLPVEETTNSPISKETTSDMSSKDHYIWIVLVAILVSYSVTHGWLSFGLCAFMIMPFIWRMQYFGQEDISQNLTACKARSYDAIARWLTSICEPSAKHGKVIVIILTGSVATFVTLTTIPFFIVWACLFVGGQLIINYMQKNRPESLDIYRQRIEKALQQVIATFLEEDPHQTQWMLRFAVKASFITAWFISVSILTFVVSWIIHGIIWFVLVKAIVMNRLKLSQRVVGVAIIGLIVVAYSGGLKGVLLATDVVTGEAKQQITGGNDRNTKLKLYFQCDDECKAHYAGMHPFDFKKRAEKAACSRACWETFMGPLPR